MSRNRTKVGLKEVRDLERALIRYLSRNRTKVGLKVFTV